MTIETHCDPKSSSAQLRATSPELAKARQSCARALPELACMSTKLTRHIFLRLAGPNKGPECCLGGAGHVVVPLFGVGGTPRGISFLPPKLMKINFKARKKKKALWAPSSPTKGATKCPLPPKQHSGPLFGPASLRKMWRVSFVLMHGELWHSSGTALASSGDVARSCAELDFGSQCVSMVM